MTGSRSADEARARLARALEALTEAFPSPVFLLDPAGTIIAANPALYARNGLPREAFVGKRFDSWVEPSDLARVRAEFDAALAGETRRYRAEGRPRDGRRAGSQVTNVPVRHGDEIIAVAGVSIDSAELDERERRSRASADLLRLAGQLARFGGWALDRASLLVTLTDESRAILEICAPEPTQLDGVIRGRAACDREVVDTAISACLQRGEAFEIEIDALSTADRPLRLRVIGEAVRDADGTIVGAHGALWDTTEVWEQRERTARLEHRLNMTLDTIGDGLIFLDRSWRIAYANARADDVLIRPHTEAEGLPIWDCLSDSARSQLEPAFRRALRESERATTRIGDEQTGAWFDVTAYPTETGLALYVRDVSDDETARLRILEAQRRIENQAALIDAARDAMIVRGLDHRIRYWNRAAAELFGWSMSEVVGRSLRELLFAEPAAHDAALAATIRDGYWVGDLTHRTRDGRVLVIESRWQLLKDEHGRPDAVFSVDTDVTQTRRNESARLRAQRMESLGTLAGGIAHDLNNVLTPILMSVQLLATDETEPGRRELLTMVESAVARGTDMIREILSFARGVEGRRYRVAIGALLDELAVFARDTLPSTVTVTTEIDADVAATMGDATQLLQVLTNLVTNARDAMPDGGRLHVTASTLLLEDSYSSITHLAPPGRYIIIDVTDTGHGMPPEVADRIFEPFYTTKELGKGTGLGLASSLAIIRSHGGFMRVYSEPDRGTRFSVILPEAESASEADEAPRIPARRLPRGRDELVLIVDDDPTIRTITAQTLESHGYRTLVAEHGEAAIALLAESERDVDLVLTDMMMPVMDGAATTAYLEEHHPEIPVIVASGLKSRSDSSAGIGMGVSAFLSKPYTTSLLLTTIRDVLDGVHDDEGEEPA